MADHIRIRQDTGTWVVRTGDAIIAESKAVQELSEGDVPPVMYFPRADVAMAFLEATAKTSHCPHKGDASYFSISTPEGEMTDVAWSYKAPKEAVAAIKDHIAFYTDRVNVEKL